MWKRKEKRLRQEEKWENKRREKCKLIKERRTLKQRKEETKNQIDYKWTAA